jgi:hypothetical protein
VTAVDVDLAANLVEFLGLTSAVGPSPDRTLRFRLGVLYPYSAALRRVYDEYVDVVAHFPDAAPLLVGEAPLASFALRAGDDASAALARYLAAVDGLHSSTAFASHATDVGVDQAHVSVQDAITRALVRSSDGHEGDPT